MVVRRGLVAMVLVLAVQSTALASLGAVKSSKDALPWAPAILQIQPRHRELRPARLRIYADHRATVPRWQERARAMVADLNELVGPTFGVRFEIESLRRWDGATRGVSASQSRQPDQDVEGRPGRQGDRLHAGTGPEPGAEPGVERRARGAGRGGEAVQGR